jgi:eukaryotic-like serine/threonine-protein kinase
VFRAHDASGDRLVAVKVFRLDLTPERAGELATALQQLVNLDLTHPVIATPIAAGLEGSVAYLAEAYVPAESLDVALRQFGPAPYEEVLRLTAQLAGAIDFAGAVGAHHGGLHPRDVLVSPDQIRLTGFGVARALERVGVKAPARRPYSAPERMEGGEWGRQADVYSLAAIIHELLLARRIAGSAAQVAGMIATVPGADRDKVRAAFLRALATDPAERYATALAFASALRDAATGTSARVGEIENTIQTRVRREKIPEAATARDEPGAQVPAPRAPAAPRTDETSPTIPALPFGAELAARSRSDAAALPTGETSATLPYADAPEPDLPLRPGAPEPAASAPPASRATPDRQPPRTAAARPIEPPGAPITADAPAASLSLSAPPDASSSDSLAGASIAHEPAVYEGRRGHSTVALVMTLFVGLFIGALGGYEYATGRGVAVAPADSAGAQTPSAPGRDSTDVAVRDSPPQRAPSDAAAPAPGATEPAPRAPVAPPRAATPEPPPALGRMLVRSTPAGAQVTIDGGERGATPLTVRDLPYGTHTVRVSRRGFEPQERRVTVGRGSRSQSLTFALVPLGQAARAADAPEQAQDFLGSLAIESLPAGASVFLNGRRSGQTPLVLSDLRAGSYALRLERTGYQRWSASVRVVAGRQERVTASLERDR